MVSTRARSAVLALDDDEQVLLIRQYRHPVGPAAVGDPGRAARRGRGAPWATARRELLEEAGYRARDWQVLADYYTSPGLQRPSACVSSSPATCTFVPETERGLRAASDEEAQLVPAWLPLDEAVRGPRR